MQSGMSGKISVECSVDCSLPRVRKQETLRLSLTVYTAEMLPILTHILWWDYEGLPPLVHKFPLIWKNFIYVFQIYFTYINILLKLYIHIHVHL